MWKEREDIWGKKKLNVKGEEIICKGRKIICKGQGKYMWRKGRGFVKKEGRICEGRGNDMRWERKLYVKGEETICKEKERKRKGRKDMWRERKYI